MHLHDLDGQAGQERFNQQLKKTVFGIRDAIQSDRESFREMLGVSPARYARICLENAPISIRELSTLAEALDTDLDLIFSGNLDLGALSRRLCGERSALPERYADSKRWVARALGIQVILTYLNTYFGPAYATAILRRLQLRADEFDDPTKFISPLIYFDLLEELKRNGVNAASIKSIGTMTLFVGQNTVGKSLATQKSPKELYRHVQDHILPSSYDRFYEYKLASLTNDGCSWVGGIREEARELFKANVIGNDQTCLYRQGVFSSFLANLLPRYAAISESECIYHGAAQCKYDLTWS